MRTLPLSALVLVLLLAGCRLITPPLALPEATQTGANTIGFELDEEVVKPRAWFKANPLSYSLTPKQLWVSFHCYFEMRDIDFEFVMEINDSLYTGAVLEANGLCSFQSRHTFCANLKDELRGVFWTQGKKPFELRITHFERGDTLYTETPSGDTTLRRGSIQYICAGTFSGTLVKGTEEIFVSNGRFDFSANHSLEDHQYF